MKKIEERNISECKVTTRNPSPQYLKKSKIAFPDYLKIPTNRVLSALLHSLLACLMPQKLPYAPPLGQER